MLPFSDMRLSSDGFRISVGRRPFRDAGRQRAYCCVTTVVVTVMERLALRLAPPIPVTV